MVLTCFPDGLLYLLRKDGFLSTEDCADMLILDPHIVQGAHAADDVIVHGDHTHFQAPAELKIRLSVSKEQNISGIAADIHQEYPQVLVQLTLDTGDGCKCLGIYKDVTEQNGEGLVVVDEMDGLRTLEILGELILQNAVVLRRQSYCQMYPFHSAGLPCQNHFPGNGKKTQNEVALISGLVSAVA